MSKLTDKSNLLNEAEKYFYTLRDSFIFTKKDSQSTSITDRLRFILFLVFPLTIALIFIDSSSYFNFAKNNEYYILIKKHFTDSPGRTFLIIFVGYVSIMILLSLVDLYMQKRKALNLLNDTLYNFCLIFDSYNGIRSYLTNRQKVYIDKMIENVNIYNNNNFITVHYIEGDLGYRRHGDAMYQITQLKNLYKWFDVTDDTKTIASGFGKFPNLIRESTKLNTNIEVIFELLELLLIFEYCNLVAQSDMQNQNEFESYSFQSILRFGKRVNELWKYDEVEFDNYNYKKLSGLLNKFLAWFNLQIESPKIITRLFAWWLFLQLPLTIIIMLLVRAFNVSLDGDVVAVIAGAPITIAASLSAVTPKRVE